MRAGVASLVLVLGGCSATPAAPRPDGAVERDVPRPGEDRVARDWRAEAGPPDLPDAAGAPDSGLDADGDGIPDATEASIAERYFPYLSLAPGDACPRHGVVYRLSPYPGDPKKLFIRYVVLYERDCGALPHAGDNEVFGALIDPQLPPPAGLLALRAISHQGGPCEKTTTCGGLPKCEPCATALRAGAAVPVVFASLNKHGGYVKKSTCDLNLLCDFGGCGLNPQPSTPPLVNAGEPGRPLVTNLSTQGFITPQNGWSEPSLQGYDPWGGKDFGGAGKVSEDLVDPAFLIGPAGCQ